MRAFVLSVALLFLGSIAAAQSVPSDAIVAFNEGKRLLKERRSKEAIQKLEQAVALAPTYAEAWTELGNAQLEKQQYQDAVRAFQSSLKLKADQSVARYNLAFSLRKLGQHREAAEQYRVYLQGQPNDADAHYGLGETLRAAGDKAAAAEAYEAYARAEKNPAQQKWVDKAKELAAQLRAEAKKEETKPAPVAAAPKPKAEPKPMTEPKPKAEPKPAGVGMHLSFSESQPTPEAAAPRRKGGRPEGFRTGLNHLQSGNYRTALAPLETADREMPNDAMILAALAGAHLGLERGAEAEETYQRAIAVASDDALPGLYLGLGEARRLLGKSELALEAYNRALTHARASTSIKRFSQERIAALKSI